MSETSPAPDWSGHIESESVGLERHASGVATLTLRSEPLNVLRQAVKRAIRAALRELEADAGVRAVVLTGNGRAFSVGSDVREFARDAEWLAAAALVDQGIGFTLEESRLPVIAALNGLTLGGGLEMALACDMRICAASARLGLPEVVVGAFASGGGTQRLPRVVGPGRAMDLLLSGRIIDAQEALDIGLVERVVADDELLATALEIGRSIAALPVAGIAASKQTLQTGLRHGPSEGYRLERELTVTVGMTDDAFEGQAAFVEKRPPRFGSGDDWVLMEAERRRRENEGEGA